MPRNIDGHANLDDLYDKIGSGGGGTLREISRTNLLLEALLRAQGIPIPVAKIQVWCTACNYRVTILQLEGQGRYTTPCPTCHTSDKIRLDDIT